MKNNDLPTRWKERLKTWVQAHSEGKRTKLGARDFSSVKVAQIEFPDGSLVQFRCAVVIIASEFAEVGVFTEHCGYHIFPLVDARIRLQDAI